MNDCDCKDDPVALAEIIRRGGEFILGRPMSRVTTPPGVPLGGPGAGAPPGAGPVGDTPFSESPVGELPTGGLSAGVVASDLALTYLANSNRGNPRLRPGLVVDERLKDFVNGVTPPPPPVATFDYWHVFAGGRIAASGDVQRPAAVVVAGGSAS